MTFIFYEGQYEDINVGVNDGINAGNNMDKVKLKFEGLENDQETTKKNLGIKQRYY